MRSERSWRLFTGSQGYPLSRGIRCNSRGLREYLEISGALYGVLGGFGGVSGVSETQLLKESWAFEGVQRIAGVYLEISGEFNGVSGDNWKSQWHLNEVLGGFTGLIERRL